MEKCFIVVENTSIEELKKIIEEIKTNDYPSIFIPRRDVDIHNTKDTNRFVVTTFIYQTSQFLDFCDAFFHAALRHQVTSMGWIKRADKTLIGLPKRQWIRCTKNNINEDDITLLDEDNQVYEIIERKDKQISSFEWERVVVVKKTDNKYSCQAFYKPDTQYGNAVCSICIGLKTFRHDDSELPIYNIRLPFLTKRLGEYSCAYVGIVGCLALFSFVGLLKYSDTLLPGISTFLWPLGIIGFGTILVLLPVIIRRIRTGHSKASGINCVLKVLIIYFLTNSILFSTNSYFHDPEPIYLHGTILDKYSFRFPGRGGSRKPIYLVDATIDKYPNSLSMHIRIDKDDPWHKGDSCEVKFYKGLFGMLVVDSVHHP